MIYNYLAVLGLGKPIVERGAFDNNLVTIGAVHQLVKRERRRTTYYSKDVTLVNQ